MTLLVVNQILFASLGVASIIAGFVYYKEKPVKKKTQLETMYVAGFMMFSGLVFIYSAYVLGL
jgi:uncharacterized membrane protein HdeD (DUF308 family)